MTQTATSIVMHLESLAAQGLHDEANAIMDEMDADMLSFVDPLMTINASMIQKGLDADFRRAFLLDTETRSRATRRQEDVQ